MFENKDIYRAKDKEERKIVKFLYVNYRNESSWRLVEPIEIRFGSNEWHTTPQWLLRAFDTEKDAEREFAIKDISFWKDEKEM